MKKVLIFLGKIYFGILEFINTSWAVKQAFILFQYAPKRPPKPYERALYWKFTKLTIPFRERHVDSYTLGPKNGESVLLLHGWGGVAGSMTNIALSLVDQGFKVIVLELPGHGKSPFKLTNMPMMAEALNAAISKYGITGPINGVGHSFGGMVIAYAIIAHNLKAGKLVTIGSPNNMDNLFRVFQRTIGLSETAYKKIEAIFKKLTNRQVKDSNLSQLIREAEFHSHLAIHDKDDAVIPYANAEALVREHPPSKLFTTKGLGHRRILTDPEVNNAVAGFMKQEKLRPVGQVV